MSLHSRCLEVERQKRAQHLRDVQLERREYQNADDAPIEWPRPQRRHDTWMVIAAMVIFAVAFAARFG